MGKLEEMRQKNKIRKQKEIDNFLGDIGVLHNNTDNIVLPSVSVKKETREKYINYYIAKYPNRFVYSVSFYKKEYPFDIYYTKEFCKKNIPEKYKETFGEIEKCFFDKKLH